MITLLDLNPFALIVLPSALIYLGGIGLMLFARRMGRSRDGGYATENEQAQTPSRLSRNCRVQFVKHGEEASVREISEQVQAAEPPMRQDDRPDLDIHFYNRAN